MKKFIILGIFGLLLAGAISVGSFYVGTVVEHYYGPFVTLELQNLTGQAVTSIDIQYRSYGVEGDLRITHKLDADKTMKAQFFMIGEGNYFIQANLADGRVLKTGDYAEPGYRMYHVIKKDEISFGTFKF